MKYLKMLGLAALSAMALMAFTAGTASATTLEVGGAVQNKAVTIESTIKSGGSALLRDTLGFSQNTCTESTVKGSTEGSTTGGKYTAGSYTGESLTGAIKTLSWNNCTQGNPTVHNAGTLHVSSAGGTNGTVTSSGAEVTTPSPAGTLLCKTGAGTHLGTLTGVSSGSASLTINAVLTCNGVSSRWTGTYTVTSPAGLGVVA